MGAASSHSCDFSVLRTVSSYSTGPSTDTSSLLEENLVSARFKYQKNTLTHLDQIFDSIIYQRKFIKSIQRPLQGLAAVRTVLGTLDGRCHSFSYTQQLTVQTQAVSALEFCETMYMLFRAVVKQPQVLGNQFWFESLC